MFGIFASQKSLRYRSVLFENATNSDLPTTLGCTSLRPNLISSLKISTALFGFASRGRNFRGQKLRKIPYVSCISGRARKILILTIPYFSTMNKIEYPVIEFGEPCVIQIVNNDDDLTSTNSIALKNRYYNSCKIVDSKLKLYIIEKAEKIGTRGSFFGLSLFHGQKIKVKLMFKDVKKISLAQCKELVIEYINKDRYFWESGREDFQSFCRDIKHANSIDSLIDLLKK